ncbi:DUF6204 family protein [Motilibacter aurantiacus]|uniref:DUF6204 family protein n=1 Tax=Motilibacter aurantiacus TaxID=2714955 RepID=UPI001407D487|nr:hypothetical protein [Motilibacter aurantiacus]
MSTRDFRIKIRGSFEALTAEQRAALLAQAGRHDVLSARFTPEGHMSYDVAARPFFTFRFAAAGEAEEDVLEAAERAEAACRAWLDERGLAYTLNDTVAEDLSQAPLAKRQRQAQRSG